MSTKKYVYGLAGVAVLTAAIVFGMLGSFQTGCAGPHTQASPQASPTPRARPGPSKRGDAGPHTQASPTPAGQ
jgi:hypothetical protein